MLLGEACLAAGVLNKSGKTGWDHDQRLAPTVDAERGGVCWNWESFVLGTLERWEGAEVCEGGTSSRSLSQDTGLHVGALASNSSVGGEREGKGNLCY